MLYDKIDTAFTYLDKNTELFKVVNVEMQGTLQNYVAVATQKAENQKEYFTGPLGNDVFQFSPMPWVSYTHISHTNSGNKDNATPLFDWGKDSSFLRPGTSFVCRWSTYRKVGGFFTKLLEQILNLNLIVQTCEKTGRKTCPSFL